MVRGLNNQCQVPENTFICQITRLNYTTLNSLWPAECISLYSRVSQIADKQLLKRCVLYWGQRRLPQQNRSRVVTTPLDDTARRKPQQQQQLLQRQTVQVQTCRFCQDVRHAHARRSMLLSPQCIRMYFLLGAPVCRTGAG